jgi:CubicO group peptidase (beta-lactamase class C family)
MRPWILLLPILLLACAASQSTGPRAGPLVTAIAEIRAEAGVPALGAAVTSPDRVLAVAVDGVRKVGTDNPARISDAFHIGSVAKTMTATLAAQLVDSGALAWNTRVAEVLPEEMVRARSEYRELTLAQLLSHEAGVQPLTDDVEIAAVRELHGDIMEQRPVAVYSTPACRVPHCRRSQGLAGSCSNPG